MARIKTNPFTQGLSGMIGRALVFRRVGNETIVASAPCKSRHSSQGQKDQRSRFRQATQYGKAQMTDPLMKEAYAQAVKGQALLTAYNAAVSDFLRAPEITGVDLSAYTGHAGETIRIRAKDDFKVAAVSISILAADGTLIENGKAQLQANGMEWVYITTVNGGVLMGNRIIIRATDLPGNEATHEALL